MGSPYGARPPSNTAYFVALTGILSLLLMLCCYFIYFCLRRVKELSQQPLPSPVKSVRPPPPPPSSCTSPTRSLRSPRHYPVQPSVRESATAMARLCQMPPSQTDTVHPRSPRAPIPLPPPRLVTSQKHTQPPPSVHITVESVETR